MSVDFQVCFPQSMIPLSSVRNVPGMTPRTIRAIGSDFTSVAEVLINDIASPSVIIVSETQLLAEVPSALKNMVLTSVAVVAYDLRVSRQSLIKFEILPVASKVSGILRLIQVFLKILLTTPGVDIFAPRLVGDALRDVGLTFGANQGGNIIADFVAAVDRTKKQILAIQARDPSLPADERLLNAKVISAAYNRNEGALVVSVELTSQAGRSATANLMV